VRSFVSVQSALVMYPIYTFGSDDQKNTWLPAMQKGEKLGCFGLTEPDFGSNPGGMRTRARKVGKEYVLNGEKMWITSGTIADVAVIWAKVENEDNKVRGFLVETTAPDSKPTTFTASVAARFGDVGLVFAGCAHPRIEPPARNGRIEVSADVLESGALRNLMGRSRRGDGVLRLRAAIFAASQQWRDQPIASHQLVQQKLTWMINEITKAQLLVLQVGRLKDAGKVQHHTSPWPRETMSGWPSNAPASHEIFSERTAWPTITPSCGT